MWCREVTGKRAMKNTTVPEKWGGLAHAKKIFFCGFSMCARLSLSYFQVCLHFVIPCFCFLPSPLLDSFAWLGFDTRLALCLWLFLFINKPLHWPWFAGGICVWLWTPFLVFVADTVTGGEQVSKHNNQKGMTPQSEQQHLEVHRQPGYKVNAANISPSQQPSLLDASMLRLTSNAMNQPLGFLYAG